MQQRAALTEKLNANFTKVCLKPDKSETCMANFKFNGRNARGTMLPSFLPQNNLFVQKSQDVDCTKLTKEDRISLNSKN